MASLSDFATGETIGSGGSNKASNLLLLLKATEREYAKQYGGSPEKWKTLGTASLLAADISESYAKNANMQVQLEAVKQQQNEIQFRGEKLLSLIGKQAKQVQSEQKAAFIKSGVKLEGSALNVLTDTVLQANEAELQKKREMDYQMAQSKIQQNMLETKMANQPFETLLSLGNTYAMAKTI